MSDYHVIDIWRVFNLGVREFPRRQVVDGTLKQSRVDYCLISLGGQRFKECVICF